MPAADFDAWVAQVRSTGSALDDAGLAELAKPGTAVPTTYRSVAPDLFERIVEQTAAGPAKAGRRRRVVFTGASIGTLRCWAS